VQTVFVILLENPQLGRSQGQRGCAFINGTLLPDGVVNCEQYYIRPACIRAKPKLSRLEAGTTLGFWTTMIPLISPEHV